MTLRYPVTKGAGTTTRLALLLWGPASSGKTTWAATAPGNKLWITFGDNEHVTVMGRKDVWVMDLSGEKAEDVFRHGIGDSPYGLDKYLADDEIGKEIETIVIDSLSAIQFLALEKAVADKVGAAPSKNFIPTMQAPGRGAYGGRNMNLVGLMKSILRMTARHGVNVIFTAHESDPNTHPDGTIESIRMSLGGQLINTMSSHMSEIWNLRQEPGGQRNRIVTVRLHGYRKPLKTRMFLQNGESSFILNYNPDLPDEAKGQMSIASFYYQWRDKNNRIPVPSNRRREEAADNVAQVFKDTV